MDFRIVVGVVVLIVVGCFLLLSTLGPTDEASLTGEVISFKEPTQAGEEDTAGEGSAEEGTTEEVRSREEVPVGGILDILPLVQLQEVEGECKLMYSVPSRRYGCFGCAGEICTVPDSRWSVASSEKYFCRAFEDGCKLYQRVEIGH